MCVEINSFGQYIETNGFEKKILCKKVENICFENQFVWKNIVQKLCFDFFCNVERTCAFKSCPLDHVERKCALKSISLKDVERRCALKWILVKSKEGECALRIKTFGNVERTCALKSIP